MWSRNRPLRSMNRIRVLELFRNGFCSPCKGYFFGHYGEQIDCKD
jgi:hypothetical protein